MLIVYLLLSSMQFSIHESFLFQRRRLSIKDENWSNSIEKKFANPSEESIKNAVLITVLLYVHELYCPYADVDGEDLPVEILKTHAASSWQQMQPQSFNTHTLSLFRYKIIWLN